MTQEFDRFLRERQYVNNVAPTTIKAYQCAWRTVLPYMPDSFDAFTAATVRNCILSLRSRGLSPESAKCHFGSLNAFFRWLHEQGLTPNRIKAASNAVNSGSSRRSPPTTFRRLLAYKPQGANERRVCVLSALLLDTGLRIDEAALHVKRKAIDLENLLVTVLGNGRKERIVPISVEGRKVSIGGSSPTCMIWRSPPPMAPA